MSDFTFSPHQRRVLKAFCHRMIPSAFGASRDSVDLVAEVEARLALGDPVLADRVARLLTLFDHPVTGLIVTGRPYRFTRLSPGRQDSLLHDWAESRLGIRRTIFQALRRLVLSTYYALPAAQHQIGYLGPLHSREPHHAWEGPLPGSSGDPEPVLRVPVATLPVRNLEPTDQPGWAEANRVPAGVIQGSDMQRETTIRAGVCVIGTGAGGAVAAARLAEAGHDVVLLEEGGYWTASDFTEEEAPMVRRLYADAGTRATDDLSVSLVQGRAVGGSTTINWLIMLRTPDYVLDEWEREHGFEGMSPQEMAPVFDLIEQETHTRVVPDDAHSPNNRIILEGARRLGWNARTGKINAQNCVRSGFCGLGCRYGAKQSTLVTFIPRALRAGARLYSDARVERIVVAERGGLAPLKRVEATILDRETGQPRGRLAVEARVVVLAAGAVGTPTILQRSGLGGGGVGKWLRFHPTTSVVGYYPEEIYAAAGIPLSAICDEFLRSDGSGYGFWIECPPVYPSTAAVAIPGFGAAHREKILRFPHLGSVIVLVRDGADKKKSNGSVSVDRKGRTRISYRLSGADRRHLIQGIRAAARLHFAAGAEESLTLHTRECRMRSEADLGLIEQQRYGPNQVALFTAHVNGTCRIGTDPRTSGCTPDGERHGVSGLYVADGSLLPTAPGINPQETIMALATVIAHRIHARHPPA